jgi:hypothetical protein
MTNRYESVFFGFNSDNFYEVYDEVNKRIETPIIDHLFNGLCVSSLPFINSQVRGSVLHTNIVRDLADRYPMAVIPMYGNIKDDFEMTMSIPTLKTTKIHKYRTIFLKFDKFTDKLGVLERKFTWLQSTFTGDKSFNSSKEVFIDGVIKDGKETKTYNLTDSDVTKNTSESTHDYDGTTKNADTPEIIPEETQEETIANFISMLSNSKGINNYITETNKNIVKGKSGNIETLKEKEHNYLEMVENIKNEYYQILDEIVSAIAITFNLE